MLLLRKVVLKPSNYDCRKLDGYSVDVVFAVTFDNVDIPELDSCNMKKALYMKVIGKQSE